MADGLNARRAAIKAMTAVTDGGGLLNAVLPDVVAPLSPQDRARTTRLATEALRWAPRSDRLLGPHLRLKPEEPVMNALRLAIYEMHVDKVPEHAAVHAAVSLTAGRKSGLVNAVLRNVLRRGTEWDTLPVPSLPKWLRKRLVAAWGKKAVAMMEEVHASPVPLDMTTKANAAEWAGTLGGTVLPTGSVRLTSAGQVSALPGYDSGAWWVQDAAAALPARLLDVGPEERVLDLCAAPGGKTMQLAASGAAVTALDISEARMTRVAENLSRTQLQAETVVADALKWKPDTKFDAILVDAPCSATGTLRRHPDLAFAKDGEGIDGLIALQSAMLDRALEWLVPGGRLVFCTCSLVPEEGEAQVRAALARHPGLVVEPAAGAWVDSQWPSDEGGLRIRPDHWADMGGIDGFYMVRLRKAA